jgi:outer membrane protein OmpA-like peptidoglycan-associated protein
MKRFFLPALLLSLASTLVHAGPLDDLGAQAVSKTKETAAAEGNKKIAAQVNQKLLAEARKNQCSFKSGSDQLEAGCGGKAQKLAQTIIDVKKTLQSKGQSGFKFIVSGHTDSVGGADKNKDLSMRRAQVMVKELIAKGVSASDIEAVGMGSERMLVKPDDTPAKQAKNRRYEVEVRF